MNELFDENNNLKSLRIASGISLIAGGWSLLFEIYFFHNFSIDVYLARLTFTLVSFVIFIVSFKNIKEIFVTILLHILIFLLISSFLYTIYKIPATLFINIQILSLLIFTTALIFSWDFRNQIIVAIYYNILFAASILLNDSGIYLLPNLFSAVLFVALISMLSIAASFIILNLRKMYSAKISEINFLFNNAPVGICNIDKKGNLIAYNNFISNLFQITKDGEVLNLFGKIKDKTVIKELKELLHASENREFKIKLNDKDNNEIYLKIISKPTKNSAKDLELLVINETAEVLAQIEKDELNKKVLEEKKSKIELLAKINHEVRTPLSSIISFFEMIDENILKSLEEVKNYSRIVRNATSELLRTINNFVDYAKIENGLMSVSKELFNLVDELNDIVVMLTPLAQNKNIKLTLQNKNQITNLVYSDMIKFRQIIINLISNSIKYTNTGMVQVKFYNSYLGKNDFEFSVVIMDTGPGIPKEKIKEIFNPFVSSQVKGGIQYSSGLGLAICNEFTHMLNGRINVESELGKGSQFTLTIPYSYSYEKTNNKV